MLQPVNLLILDEPTNHLDMPSKDVLKQAIKDFDGTVILVSHDREFLDGLVEKVYEFGGGKVRECLGGIYEFLEKKKLSSLQELELSKSKAVSDPVQPTESVAQAQENKPEQRKLTYAEQRERDKMLRRAAKKVADAEAAVSEAESALSDIEAKIAAGNVEMHILAKPH